MSRKVHIGSLSQEVREQFVKELEIKLEGSTFSYYSKTKYIYPFDVTDEYIYIPFAYGGECSNGPFLRPDKESFSEINCKFIGKLRPPQKKVKKEAISHLNSYGSTIIAAMPGFGKCH